MLLPGVLRGTLIVSIVVYKSLLRYRHNGEVKTMLKLSRLVTLYIHDVIKYVMNAENIPYSLKFSRIKYFADWLNSAQKQIFTDKIFVVERELCKATPTQLLVRTTFTLAG